MMKRSLMFMAVMTVMGHSIAEPQNAWRFDYDISGPRDARPQVHGDSNEVFLQFPARIKPTSFSVSGCNGKHKMAKPETRGPYFVLKNAGNEIQVKTNRGLIKIVGRDECKYIEPVVVEAPKPVPVKTLPAPVTKSSKAPAKASNRAAVNKPAAKSNVNSAPQEFVPVIQDWTIKVAEGESLRNALSRQLRPWGISLSWSLGRDRKATRDMVFKGDSAQESIDQVLQVFDLRGWYASAENTLYIIKESD